MKKLNKKIVINNFKNKHGDKYDYSLFDYYMNNKQKIKIICPEHGLFEKCIKNHISGSGCKKCSMNTQLKENEFINKSKQIHKKYDYSLVKYKNIYTNVKIICPEHGVYEQSPQSHLRGYGCKKCSNREKLSTESFILKSNIIYNNFFDYSLVNYINNRTNVKINCPIHGIFEQRPSSHLNGKGCKKCKYNKVYNTTDFINKSNIIHDNRYDYSLVDYKNSLIKIKIICHKHGIFEQSPYIHILGKGCPSCKKSKSEIKIKKILDDYNIDYINEKTFKKCKDNNLLRFDFYLPFYNTCIEFDGEHHFKSIKKWGGDLKLIDTKNKDSIKTEYCKTNNIKLFRIKYDDNIEEKIKEIISSL